MNPLKLDRLGARIAERQDELLEQQAPDVNLRQRLATLASGAQARPSRGQSLAWQLALFAAILLVGVAGWRSLRSAPALSFTVGEPARRGVLGELTTAGAQGLPIRFSEGTSLLLEPEARARVVAMGPRGADVVVESGRANVAVVPRQGGDWTVRAGPFTVRVKGTQFDVAYDVALDRFTLRLYHGQVAVSGCGVQERALRAGEQLVASCSRRELSVGPLVVLDGPAPALVPPKPVDAPSVPAPLGPSSPVASPAADVASARAAGRSWVELSRAGKYGEAYELVRDTFSQECAQGDAERTLLLGETARLSGHASEARRAYSALRDRFSGSSQAAQAAFALGRLAIDAAADRVAAEHWFATYLQERPGGPLASSALGRLLELRLQAGDRRGAAQLARRYLQRYPSGPRAVAARQVLAASHVEEQP